jgi:hypothetical protein
MATKYVVLKKSEECWEEGVTTEAASARAAIRSACLNEKDGGEYVAVPLRSWRPLIAKVETEQRLIFSS